ncbi:2-dehydro-3-deoxyglucarate aldolase [Alkalibacter rhizosphaerae]|uniref:2-dehydro-3-deoxyglucarate aldolase n=1 Tax=Alkalibacter rhizosphaerae TaxID=2815577 RepID=A0A974XGY4_9FIRM|nr:2-dehydro-3-deoxyglucarate aldolase [Alkalibacter rhizosphaerae]
MLRKNNVKQRLLDGKTVIGSFSKLADPSAIEIMGLAGLDFFVIDNEHVAMNKESITNLVRASDITEIVPIVRVKENNASEILQALDCGALGVHVPNIDTYEEALRAIRSTKYIPQGNRGFALSHRAAGYGFYDKDDYLKRVNQEILTVLHCETLESVDNLDKILDLEDLDVIFIGPMDLSQSMGSDVMGNGTHPNLVELKKKIIQKVIEAGKVVGTVAGNVQEAKELMELGVRYIPISSDQGMIATVSKQIVHECIMD